MLVFTDPIWYTCLFCNRKNKSGENCRNCKEKIKIKTIFKTWKKYVDDLNSKVDFGKHMNLVTYKQLCREKCYDDYRSSILSDVCWLVDQDVKNKIINFINWIKKPWIKLQNKKQKQKQKQNKKYIKTRNMRFK